MDTTLIPTLNPLHPNSDQQQFSPNNIHTLSRDKVMRINKMIIIEKIPWSFIKFSQLILKGNVWRSVWRICMWILGLKGLTVLTVITIFALWPWDLNSIFLGRRVHKKNQFEKECLLNPHWGNRTTKQNTGLFRFHHHCNPTVTNLCSSNFFSLSTCVTPTLKCTENSSTVQVLSQHAILAFWYFKKLNSEKKN